MLRLFVILVSVFAFSKVAFAAGADSTSKKPEHEVVKAKEHEHHEKNGKHKKHKNKQEKHEKHEEEKHEKHEEHEHSKEAK